jgi:hypothetical protein
MEKVINKESLPKGDKLTIRIKKYRSKPMKMTPFLIKVQKEKNRTAKALKEMDKFLSKLREKNGQTKY